VGLAADARFRGDGTQDVVVGLEVWLIWRGLFVCMDKLLESM